MLAASTTETRIGKVLNGFDAELQTLVNAIDIGRHGKEHREGLARVVVHPVPDDMSMVEGHKGSCPFCAHPLRLPCELTHCYFFFN
jgi:hypothetical protein